MAKLKEEALKVHCIDQEYWHIHRCGCDCGGAWKKGLQTVGSSQTNPDVDLDTIWCSCSVCGCEKTFVFDISSFYRRFETFMQVLVLAKEAEDEPVRKMLLEAGQNRMELIIKAIGEFGQAGDRLALDYIHEAVRHFQQSAVQDSG